MRTWIKNGHILDPATGMDGKADVWIEDGRIAEVSAAGGGEPGLEADRVIDAGGAYVMPGFIDLHVHFRDPGLTYKETIGTGGRAAAKGGVTTVCAMPNTKPVTDTKEMIEAMNARSREECCVHLIQLGAVTRGQMGKELADIRGMAAAGCMAVSEDGKSVMDASLYRKGMKEAKAAGAAVFAHCEDITMVEGGVMNADAKAQALGLPGITNAVEDVIAARDILLAKETGVRLHLCHCSTEDSVKMVKAAKEAGIAVTAEVCPHHFTLTTDDITEDDGNFKMNPPLRGKADVSALIQGLKDGVIDVISTDHAPHAASEKECSMKEAAFGIVGLETSAALTYTELVDTGILTPMQMAEKMSANPAKILGLDDRGGISEGKLADIVIFDPEAEWTIDKEKFVSKGKNTPFHGKKVKGEVRCTLVCGNVVYEKQR